MNRFEQLTSAQDGLITTRQCEKLGISPDDIKHWVRAKRWSLITRGVYLVDADLAGDDPMSTRRLIRAGHLALGPRSVVTLASAAHLHGIEGLRPERYKRIHLSLAGPNARPRRLGLGTLVPHQFVLRPSDVVEVEGMRVTTAMRTVADLMLDSPRYEAVSILDSALNRGRVADEDLCQVDRLMYRRRGSKKARPWIGLADGRAESPLETRVRLRCLEGGVPPDELQVEITSETGEVVARVDMLWSRHKLIGEADGEDVHSRPSALFHDRTRQNALAAAGFTVIRFTWGDTLEADRIPRIVRAAMRRTR